MTAVTGCLQDDEGTKIVTDEVKEGTGAASALAFIAGKIKDHGAVPSALNLYRRALELDFSNPSFALSYVHTLELEQDFDTAVAFAIKYCKACPVQLGGGLELFEVLGSLPVVFLTAFDDSNRDLLDEPICEGDKRLGLAGFT